MAKDHILKRKRAFESCRVIEVKHIGQKFKSSMAKDRIFKGKRAFKSCRVIEVKRIGLKFVVFLQDSLISSVSFKQLL